LAQTNLPTQGHVEEQCSIDSAKIAITAIHHWNVVMRNKQHKHHAFMETCSFKHGLKTFGKCAKTAALDEAKQLHNQAVF